MMNATHRTFNPLCSLVQSMTDVELESKGKEEEEQANCMV